MNNDFHGKQKVFQKYLQGNLSEDEESKLINWINLSDDNFQIFKRYISENQFFQISEEANVAWQRISAKLYPISTKNNGKKITFPDWVRIAALIVVAFVSGILINNIYQIKSENFISNEIIVPKGEKSQLILSDGSKVFLNSDSHLRYPSSFSEKERKVILSGEAFFEIEKDPSNPFIVETSGFNVKVTGTTFNVSAYNDDKENSVTLHSGRVTIENDGSECKIKPGEKYVLNNKTRKSEIIQTDIQGASLWIENVIVIDNQNLEDIQKILERKFNVNIEITDDNLKYIRYTGQFKPHETLVEIFTLIKDVSPIKFEVEFNKTKDHITIKMEK